MNRELTVFQMESVQRTSQFSTPICSQRCLLLWLSLTDRVKWLHSWKSSTLSTNTGGRSTRYSIVFIFDSSYNFIDLFPIKTSQRTPALSISDVISTKLTSKANRHLQDPINILTSHIPPWLTQIANAWYIAAKTDKIFNLKHHKLNDMLLLICCSPFLFSFDTRHMLFYAESFDRDRAMQRLNDSDTASDASPADARNRIAPRIEKKRVSEAILLNYYQL